MGTCVLVKHHSIKSAADAEKRWQENKDFFTPYERTSYMSRKDWEKYGNPMDSVICQFVEKGKVNCIHLYVGMT